MDTAAALRRRIDLAEELLSVTGTMKSLAAVTLRQYERSLHVLHEYSRCVELGLQVLLRARCVPVAEVVAGDAHRLFVVFGSGRGLCGPVNRHVALAARAAVDALPTGCEHQVVAAGGRVAIELEGVGLDVREVLDAPSSAEGIQPLVEELLVLTDAWRSSLGDEGMGASVVLVRPRLEDAGRQYHPAVVPLLPIDPERLRALASAPWPTRVLPEWRGQGRQTLSALTRQLLFVDLHRAFAETQVCVHRARLAAMQGAEESIGTRLEELATRYHRRRQAAITSELLDVISGYEAAGGPAR